MGGLRLFSECTREAIWHPLVLAAHLLSYLWPLADGHERNLELSVRGGRPLHPTVEGETREGIGEETINGRVI